MRGGGGKVVGDQRSERDAREKERRRTLRKISWTDVDHEVSTPFIVGRSTDVEDEGTDLGV